MNLRPMARNMCERIGCERDTCELNTKASELRADVSNSYDVPEESLDTNAFGSGSFIQSSERVPEE